MVEDKCLGLKVRYGGTGGRGTTKPFAHLYHEPSTENSVHLWHGIWSLVSYDTFVVFGGIVLSRRPRGFLKHNWLGLLVQVWGNVRYRQRGTGI